jgi:hypothetical protein
MTNVLDYVSGWIDSLQLTRVTVEKIEQTKGIYVATIIGGLNGRGDWSFYIRQIQKIIDSLPGSWIVDLDCDNLDDLWYLELGFNLDQILSDRNCLNIL